MTREGIWIIALMICMVIQEARMIKIWQRLKRDEQKNVELHAQSLKVFDEVYENFDNLKELIEEKIDGITGLIRIQKSQERNNQYSQSDKGT